MGEKEQDIKSLERKIDQLIQDNANSKKEHKREIVLSKVDGLYNVLIAISTFTVGILISQHAYFFNQFSTGFTLSIIGIVISMIVSYAIGLRGMPNGLNGISHSFMGLVFQ